MLNGLGGGVGSPATPCCCCGETAAEDGPAGGRGAALVAGVGGLLSFVEGEVVPVRLGGGPNEAGSRRDETGWATWVEPDEEDGLFSPRPRRPFYLQVRPSAAGHSAGVTRDIKDGIN